MDFLCYPKKETEAWGEGSTTCPRLQCRMKTLNLSSSLMGRDWVSFTLCPQLVHEGHENRAWHTPGEPDSEARAYLPVFYSSDTVGHVV